VEPLRKQQKMRKFELSIVFVNSRQLALRLETLSIAI
ncbi:hypothetical protein LCGC14_2401610, partial [marine sediment metagenome]